MATLTAPRPAAPLLTIEDVLALPDSDGYELIDGVLKEREMSNLSGYVGSELHTELSLYARANGGWAYATGPWLPLWPRRPNHFVVPDASYFAPDQFDGGLLPPGSYVQIAPALVVEVVSPGDGDREIATKVADYLEAGVQMLWVVYPEVRLVHVYQPGRRVVLVQDGEELIGGDVLPGFRCDLAKLMPPTSVRSDA